MLLKQILECLLAAAFIGNLSASNDARSDVVDPDIEAFFDIAATVPSALENLIVAERAVGCHMATIAHRTASISLWGAVEIRGRCLLSAARWAALILSASVS